MADSKIPPTFKSLLPFVRRADELERDSTRPESKLIAYYCRQYAMELGIKLRENDSSDEATNYLLSLMDRLEEDKAKLPTFSQDEGKEICEDFAIEIFTKADDEDRAGCADKNTARTFYAAGTFFDILNQFGDVSEDMMEKRRYCKYKAATILKAIKEGTTPAPGPPGAGYATGDGYSELAFSQASAPPSQQTSMPNLSSLSLNSIPPAPSMMPVPSPTPSSASAPAAFPSFTSSASSFGPSGGDPNSWNGTSAPSAPSPPPAYTPPPHPAQSYAPPPAQMFTPPQAQNYANPPPPQQPAYTPQVPAAPPSPHQQSAYTPQVPLAPPPAPAPTPYTPQTVPARNSANAVTQNEINDAMECAKFAVAALKVKDIELAIQRLEMALKCIK